MIIHRSDPSGNFLKLPNETARDERLSYAARGYLAEILGRPDDWDTTADATWRRAQRERGEKAESRRDIQAIWAELKAARYMISDRVSLSGGKFGMEVHVFDRPWPSGMPLPGKSVPPAETRVSAAPADLPQAGKSARPAKTEVVLATDLPQAGKSVSGKSVRPAKAPVSAGRTDLPRAGTSSRRQKERRPTTKRRSLSETLELIVTGATGVTPDEARETVAAIIEAQHPLNPAAYFRTLAKNGDLPLWLDKVRGRVAPGNGPALIADIKAVAAPTPVPPRYADRCGWCSRLGHDADNCSDRPEPEASPVLTEAETPCAAGEKCRQKHTHVEDGREYHEACQIFGGLRATGKQAKHADHDAVGRRIAAEQLAGMRAAASSQGGGHAA